MWNFWPEDSMAQLALTIYPAFYFWKLQEACSHTHTQIHTHTHNSRAAWQYVPVTIKSHWMRQTRALLFQDNPIQRLLAMCEIIWCSRLFQHPHLLASLLADEDIFLLKTETVQVLAWTGVQCILLHEADSRVSNRLKHPFIRHKGVKHFKTEHAVDVDALKV